MIRSGIERLRGIVRRSGNRSGKVLVLLYHRVAELHSDPWSLGVTPSHFAAHLEVLRQHAHPIGLRQLSQALLNGHLPNRAVVVTFDDGYADNLHNAKPLLERYDVPASVFLTTGYIGHEREFWWDELDRIFLQPGTLPETLSLSINGDTYQWQLKEAAHYSEDVSWRHRRWRAREEAPNYRHSLYKSLWELVHPMSEGERRKVLDALVEWAGLDPAGRPSHQPLSLEEAVALAQGGLVEVGAHTVTHPALAKLPRAKQREEILGSKAQLEDILAQPMTSFAYPYGSLSAEVADIVQQAGFACACSTVPGVVERSTDPFCLPRVPVRDCNRERFAKRLSRWFSD